MIGYVLVNDSNQYYHPVHGYLSIDGPDVRVMDLSECIKFQSEMALEDETEIYKVTVTYEKVAPDDVKLTKLEMLEQHLETLPSYVQDLIRELIGAVAPIVLQRWTVDSHESGRQYEVTVNTDHEWTCTCPDFKFRSGPKGRYCKHIHAVQNRNSSVPFRGFTVRGPR